MEIKEPPTDKEKELTETHKYYGKIIVRIDNDYCKMCEGCTISCDIKVGIHKMISVGIFCSDTENIIGQMSNSGIMCNAWVTGADIGSANTIISFSGNPDGHKILFSRIGTITESSRAAIIEHINNKESLKKTIKQTKKYSSIEFLKRITHFIRRENERRTKEENMRES